MTDERLAELRALSEKAPPGPWKFFEEEDRIYASWIAVPELLDAIERVRVALVDAPEETVNWPKPGDRSTYQVSNICGSHGCADVPEEPGPCNTFIACECDWPAAADVHCKKCQHEAICHFRKIIRTALEVTQNDSAGSTVPQENDAAGGSHKT